MKYPGKAIPDNSLWYLPLREDPLFVLTALLLLLALVFKKDSHKCTSCPCLVPEKHDRLGLKIGVNGNPGKAALTVYLVHRSAQNRDPSKDSSGQQSDGSKETRIIRRISIPGESFHRKKERFQFLSSKKLFVGCQYWINAEDLIRRAETPENLSKCLRKEFSLLGKSERRARLKLVD